MRKPTQDEKAATLEELAQMAPALRTGIAVLYGLIGAARGNEPAFALKRGYEIADMALRNLQLDTANGVDLAKADNA